MTHQEGHPTPLTQEEFSKAITVLLSNEDTRLSTLEALNHFIPHNPEIELALKYHADPGFRKWLEDSVWQINMARS